MQQRVWDMSSWGPKLLVPLAVDHLETRQQLRELFHWLEESAILLQTLAVPQFFQIKKPPQLTNWFFFQSLGSKFPNQFPSYASVLIWSVFSLCLNSPLLSQKWSHSSFWERQLSNCWIHVTESCEECDTTSKHLFSTSYIEDYRLSTRLYDILPLRELNRNFWFTSRHHQQIWNEARKRF